MMLTQENMKAEKMTEEDDGDDDVG